MRLIDADKLLTKTNKNPKFYGIFCLDIEGLHETRWLKMQFQGYILMPLRVPLWPIRRTCQKGMKKRTTMVSNKSQCMLQGCFTAATWNNLVTATKKFLRKSNKFQKNINLIDIRLVNLLFCTQLLEIFRIHVYLQLRNH